MIILKGYGGSYIVTQGYGWAETPIIFSWVPIMTSFLIWEGIRASGGAWLAQDSGLGEWVGVLPSPTTTCCAIENVRAISEGVMQHPMASWAGLTASGGGWGDSGPSVAIWEQEQGASEAWAGQQGALNTWGAN